MPLTKIPEDIKEALARQLAQEMQGSFMRSLMKVNDENIQDCLSSLMVLYSLRTDRDKVLSSRIMTSPSLRMLFVHEKNVDVDVEALPAFFRKIHAVSSCLAAQAGCLEEMISEAVRECGNHGGGTRVCVSDGCIFFCDRDMGVYATQFDDKELSLQEFVQYCSETYPKEKLEKGENE